MNNHCGLASTTTATYFLGDERGKRKLPLLASYPYLFPCVIFHAKRVSLHEEKQIYWRIVIISSITHYKCVLWDEIEIVKY
jgi:hypothetical protein